MLFLIVASCGTSKTVHSKTIFRHINLGKYGRIELGDKMTNLESLVVVKNNRFYLKENTFGGAHSIEVKTNKNSIIDEFIFDYGQSQTFESKVNDYLELGIPKKENNKAIWNDGKTEFSIYVLNRNLFSKMKRLK